MKTYRANINLKELAYNSLKYFNIIFDGKKEKWQNIFSQNKDCRNYKDRYYQVINRLIYTYLNTKK